MITWRQLGEEIAKLTEKELDMPVTILDFSGEYFEEDVEVEEFAFDHITLEDTKPLLVIGLNYGQADNSQSDS